MKQNQERREAKKKSRFFQVKEGRNSCIFIVMETSGVLLIDKESGCTSRQIDNAIQKLFHTKKVGHLGTLDPFATGLLLVAVNKGTKFLPFFRDEEKTYEATLLLGQATSTGDKDGEFTERKEIPPLTKERIEEVLSSFLGDSKQLPPMTSAIKVNGRALYELAHKGEEIERKPRDIYVFSIELLSFSPNTIVFRTKVSKGTYIRVLGEDIAKALGSVGHLTALRRTEVGDITLEHAFRLSEVSKSSLENPLIYLSHIPQIEVDEDTASKVKNGVALSFASNEKEVLLTCRGVALAIYTRDEGGRYRSFRGLF